MTEVVPKIAKFVYWCLLALPQDNRQTYTVLCVHTTKTIWPVGARKTHGGRGRAGYGRSTVGPTAFDSKLYFISFQRLHSLLIWPLGHCPDARDPAPFLREGVLTCARSPFHILVNNFHPATRFSQIGRESLVD